VAALLGATDTRVPAYLSGLPGGDASAVRQRRGEGFRVFKIFHDGHEDRALRLIDTLQADGCEVAFDALWRLSLPDANQFLRELEACGLRWLECPFPPDEIAPHQELARTFRIPLALGESYRTLRELAPFLELGNLALLQPDLGRCGDHRNAAHRGNGLADRAARKHRPRPATRGGHPHSRRAAELRTL
jgi:galactonate dehydratase